MDSKNILYPSIIGIFCWRVNVAEISEKLTEKTAHKLAVEANEGSTKNLKYYWYDEKGLMSPPFYSYQGINSNPETEGSFGFFAVNPWTGDVWSLWDCKKISTPASLKMQALIKKQFTADELKQYKRLSDLKPICVVDDAENPSDR